MDALHQNMALASQIEFMGQAKEISGLMEIEMNKYHSCLGFQGADEEECRAWVWAWEVEEGEREDRHCTGDLKLQHRQLQEQGLWVGAIPHQGSIDQEHLKELNEANEDKAEVERQLAEADSKVQKLMQEVDHFPQQLADAKDLTITKFKKSFFLDENLVLLQSYVMEIGQIEVIDAYAEVEPFLNKKDFWVAKLYNPEVKAHVNKQYMLFREEAVLRKTLG